MTDTQDLQTYAEYVARFLPPGWTVSKQHDRAVKLEHESGAAFSILSMWNKPGRVRISGWWPRGLDGHHYVPNDQPEITCAIARGPEAVARDIERRFLSAYLPLYRERKAAQEASDERDMWANRAAADLAEVLGGELRESRFSPDLTTAFTRSFAGLTCVDGCVSTLDGKVDFTLHDIPLHTARRLCALLREELSDGTE